MTQQGGTPMHNGAVWEKQTPTGLFPQWATITQVSEALAIPRNAVRSAVRRAVASGETWVKKETATDGKSIYLIDTHHASYQAHEARWKQGKTARDHLAAWLAASHQYVSSMWSKQRWFPDREAASGSICSCREHAQVASGLHIGPHFQHWLAARGVEIFTNRLALGEQAHPWQWHWNELHGAGYSNEEEALIAALQCRFEAYERERDDLGAALFQTLTQEESEEEPAQPARFPFFFHKHTSS